MANFASYFVKNYKSLTAKDRYVIKGLTYRFTMLTPRLIRLEYNKHGILVQKYGVHVFHTDNEKVFSFLSRFTEWNDYCITCFSIRITC